MTNENISNSYPYNTDYSDENCNKEEVLKVGSYLLPIFFTVVFVLSCIGNILVLIILVLYENLKSLTNILILNLALSDLLFTSGLPFWASYYIWGWIFEDIGCKVVKFVFYAGFYSSVFFLTLMTVQRYMAVVHPLSDWERRRGFTIIPVIIIWMLSGSAALLGTLRSKLMQESNQTTLQYCEYDSIQVKHSIIYLQNAYFFIAFTIMGFCYIKMLQTITKTRTKRRHKTVRLILCISLVFFIGWAPYNIVMFLRSLTDHGIQPFTECGVNNNLDYAFYVCRLLAFSHCCLNPMSYIILDVKLQNHSKAFLRRVLRV